MKRRQGEDEAERDLKVLAAECWSDVVTSQGMLAPARFSPRTSVTRAVVQASKVNIAGKHWWLRVI